MWDDSDIFGALMLGVILGLLFGILFMVFTEGTPMSNYPGLSEHLSEQRDDCEARPNVISCEWDEDKVDYVPKDKANG